MKKLFCKASNSASLGTRAHLYTIFYGIVRNASCEAITFLFRRRKAWRRFPNGNHKNVSARLLKKLRSKRKDVITAIYHCSIKIISRGKGKSAVAAAAYRSGEKLLNDYDGMLHDFTKKGGVVHTEILLPDNAPREIEIALPIVSLRYFRRK